MQKIPTLFEREFGPDVDCPATEGVTPGCEWVLAGNAKAYHKLDGSCVLYTQGELWRRRTIRAPNYAEGLPDGWVPAQRKPRENEKWPGWEQCDPDDPADQYHFDGLENSKADPSIELPERGTLELIGPKNQGNPHEADRQLLIPHESMRVPNGRGPGDGTTTSWRLIREWLEHTPEYEGLVWQHREHPEVQAKIKRTDFGLEWPVEGDQ